MAGLGTFFNVFASITSQSSSIMTIASFISGQVPTSPSGGATLRIKAGLPRPENSGDSLGGSINQAYSWGVNNEFLGLTGGCYVNAAGICDLIVDQNVAGQRAEYIGLSNNDDATCIAWVSVTQYDGTVGGAWTGDIGYHCGQRWYPNEEKAGQYKDSGEDYIPKCTWLDQNGSNDITNAAMKFSVSAYGKDVESVPSNAIICGSTLYGSDSGPIPGTPAKRDMPDYPDWILEQLVISNWTSQTALEVCDSPTSWGPDFIGSDGMFCDMTTKTLTPLCSSESSGSSSCIEVDEEAAAVVKRSSVARRATEIVHKTYKTIKKWGQ